MIPGTFGGSPIVSDLKDLNRVLTTLKALFRGDGSEFTGLGFDARKKWFSEKKFAFWKKHVRIVFHINL